jgi:hypothetical protein
VEDPSIYDSTGLEVLELTFTSYVEAPTVAKTPNKRIRTDNIPFNLDSLKAVRDKPLTLSVCEDFFSAMTNVGLGYVTLCVWEYPKDTEGR